MAFLRTGEGTVLKLSKLIAIPAIALTAGLGVAACGSVKAPALGLNHTLTASAAAPVTATTTHPANPKRVATTPAAAPAPIQAAALPTVSTNSPIDGAQAVEPSTIDLSVDGNGDLNGLTWSSWTAYRAEGSGSFNVNNCQPNCAQGTTVDVTVSVALSAPTSGSSPYFTAMTLTDSSGNTNTYAAGSNGSLNVVSDALYIADEAPAAAQPAPAGLTRCGGGAYAGADTSCPFALNVAADYTGSGPDYANSPVTGLPYTMNCGGEDPVVCTGAGNALVQFHS